MIREFKYTPKAQNNKARHLGILLLSVGFLIFSVSMFIDSYRGVVALLAMAFVIGGLWIAVKYVMSSYCYELFCADGEWLFIVTQITGKRETTLCRVELSDIISLKKVSRKDEDNDKSYQRYSYLQTFMAESFYVMTVVTRYERSKISLEIPDTLAEELASFAEQAREEAKYNGE